jgi:hypothetical protein
LKHVIFKSQGSIPLFKVVSFFIPKFCEKFCHYFFHNVCWWKTIIQMYWCSLCHCLECELVTHFFFAKIFFGNLIEFPAKKLFKIQYFFANAIEFLQIQTLLLYLVNWFFSNNIKSVPKFHYKFVFFNEFSMKKLFSITFPL